MIIKSVIATPCLISLIAALWTCDSSSQIERQSLPQDEWTILRNEVREIIRPDCGSCHTSSLATAKPGAIRVFDLAKEDWAAIMSAKQLQKFKQRLSGGMDEAGKRKLIDFLGAELARRGSTKSTTD
jgi:hypothetical protein